MIGTGAMMIVFFPELKRPDSMDDAEKDKAWEAEVDNRIDAYLHLYETKGLI